MIWKLNTESRLHAWQNFRHSLDDMDIQTALKETENFWQSAPHMPYYLEHESTERWPDPWELITENYYCDVAKCLGMLYTIYLSSHNDVETEIRVYRDKNSLFLYSVLWIDEGKYILNWSEGEVVNTKLLEEKEPVLLHRYTRKDLQLEKY